VGNRAGGCAISGIAGLSEAGKNKPDSLVHPTVLACGVETSEKEAINS